MDFVSSLKWVGRGVAKSHPERVELTREELQELIRSCAKEEEEDSDAEELPETDHQDFNFDNYDNEEENYAEALGIGSLALYSGDARDPHINIPGMDEEDSDQEDEEIRSDDNLVLVGKGRREDGGTETVEVHVYNQQSGDLYVHHDVTLSSVPLCLETIHVAVGDSLSDKSCFLAAGLMSSSIELYDINIINPTKPQARLGKKKDPALGHTDAVLDLSWNTSYPHILASSSVDKSAVLWDLETAKLSNRFIEFTGNVENVKWEPEEGHCLIACDAAGFVKLLDCRMCQVVKEWSVKGEALVADWGSHNNFVVGTSKGRLYGFDCRTDSPFLNVKVDRSDVTGLSYLRGYNGLVVCSCVSGELQLIDTVPTPHSVLFSRSFAVEQLHSLASNPENPLVTALGGAKKKGSYFTIVDLNRNNQLDEVLNFRKNS